jgi:hypothetical protein
MYERLTKWEVEGCASVNGCSPIDKDMANAIDRLCELEDKIEQGKILELPCKVGQKVYCIWQYSDFAKTEPPFIKEETVCSFIIDEGVAKIIPENYGEMVDNWHRLMAVAFTKEEAERALERSENGK